MSEGMESPLMPSHAAVQAEAEAISETMAAFAASLPAGVGQLVDLLAECVHSRGRIAIFGNGGSAAIAQHIAAELVGRFSKPRRALPAIALAADASVLTAVANDFSFEEAFGRQIEALVQSGDVAIGMSTSGGSENVARGLATARDLDATAVALVGCEPGVVGDAADLCVLVPSSDTPRIQELHLAVLHIVCRQLEEILES
jgi:D-sedoheptulose 7-phosphate isomerase